MSQSPHSDLDSARVGSHAHSCVHSTRSCSRLHACGHAQNTVLTPALCALTTSPQLEPRATGSLPTRLPTQAAHGPGCPRARSGPMRLPLLQATPGAFSPQDGRLPPPTASTFPSQESRLPGRTRVSKLEATGRTLVARGKGLRNHPSAASNLKMKERKEH